MSIDWVRRSITVLTVAPTTVYALSTDIGSVVLLHALHMVALWEFTTGASIVAKNKSSKHVLMLGILITSSASYGLYSYGFTITMMTSFIIIYHLSQLFCAANIEMGDNFKHALIDSICLLWVSSGFSHLILLRTATPYGFGHCIFLILCVWNVDNGALFAGSSARTVFKENDIVGRLLLPPNALQAMDYLSPNKSWTGVIGGIFLGCLTAMFLVTCMSSYQLQSGPIEEEACYLIHISVTIPCWQPSYWYTLGVGISLLAVVGDLLESSLKRFVRIKDSGKFFPGHGGCLDRMDSALLAGTWYFYVVHFLAEQVSKASIRV